MTEPLNNDFVITHQVGMGRQEHAPNAENALPTKLCS
jgi:hypothetical protein